jgi:hypothetical protein
MSTVEEELADLLARRAATVPADPRLLAAVKARSRRQALRQRAGLAVVAVAALVAGLVVVPSVVLGRTQPSAGTSIGSGVAAPTAFLVGAPRLAPSFPLTPSYLPAGVKRQPEQGKEPGSSYVSYVSTKGGWPAVDLQVFSIRPPADGLVKAIPATVQGRPGELVLDQKHLYVSVTWLARPGRWISVTGSNRWATRDGVLRVANGLLDQPLAGAPAFRIALAPAGFILDGFAPNSVSLAPSAGRPKPPQSDPRTITVSVNRASARTDGHGKRVSVGNRSGWLTTTRAGEYSLVLKLSATTRLEIVTPVAAPWNEEELGRFAAGVTYLGPVPPAGG